jgi:hypothetical protein
VIFIYQEQFGTLVYSLAILWGVQDSVVNTHVAEILGFEFVDNVRSYAVFNIVQCVVVFFILVGEAYVTTTSQYY